MSSFCRIALALGLVVSGAPFVLAQAFSSSSNPPEAQQSAPEQPSAAPQNQGAQSVQARIRARREQRRVQAMREVYSHLYDLNLNIGYLRFVPGSDKQRVTMYSWDTGLTRYYNQRLGVTLDARGHYGTPFVGVNFSGMTRPAISFYTFQAGPTYRFYMQPKYSISGRVMGGYAYGNFSSDTNGFGSTRLGMYPDGGSFAASAAIMGEYNVSPSIGLRLAPEYFFTGFGSTMQYSRGFTAGFVFRVGKQ